MLGTVADDQSRRTIDRDESLHCLSHAEGFGVGEHKLVGVRTQQIDEPVSANALIGHRAAQSIQRQ
jgi:hypothetical protein